MDRHRYLHLPLKPSHLLQRYLASLLLLSWLAIALCQLHGMIRVAVAVGATVYVLHCYRALQYPLVQALRLDDGDWHLETRQGERKMRLCPDSVVTYSVTVLHFVDDNGQHERVLLLPDSGDPDTLRRLRRQLLNPQGQQA